MAHRILVAVAIALVALQAPADNSTPAAVTGLPHIRIDVAARTIEIDCRVVLARGPLELLLCLTGTKEHESILATEAKPSHLHAALLALGVPPGRPGRWDLSPDGENRYVPPAGAKVQVSLRYTDRDGTPRLVDSTRWIRRTRPPAGAVDLTWVFAGSLASATGPYPADQSGDIISVANFPRSVIDVPFASTTADEMLWFEADPNAIPVIGTKVIVILTPEPRAARAPVARAVFGIDRFGRYTLDGLAIAPDRIATWAEQFVTHHARPYIVVHAAARALVFDLQRLRDTLEAAGIADLEVHTRPIAGEILPRTQKQADAAMHSWKKRFADTDQPWSDPAAAADAVLRQIEYRREELADLLTLWSTYRQRLTAAVGAHRKPVTDKEPAP